MSATPIIEAEGISKLYRLGTIGSTTIRESIERLALRLRGKGDDPRLRPDPAFPAANGDQSGPYPNSFWALRDVSFSVQKGEIVGILGRNGAGKSTLLKILSRITEPTVGRIVLRGRVASLLEVGTGFHPELSGRDNIFLNGAMLGMRRAEIARKFDEIVDFAEVHQFIDTPVKRYSSGMYVRLAFAVAAHLEPEILIVDEVLAVGDAQFQKKCLGKMQDVSRSQGRTVLFVSHNMDAVQRLCTRCMIFEHGRLAVHQDKTTALAHYLATRSFQSLPNDWIDLTHSRRTGSGEARITAVRFSSLNPETACQPFSNGPLEFQITISSDAARSVGSIAVAISTHSGAKLINADTIMRGESIQLRQGTNHVRLRIERLHLNAGGYVVGLWLGNMVSAQTETEPYDCIESALEIEVVHVASEGVGASQTSLVTCQLDLLEVT